MMELGIHVDGMLNKLLKNFINNKLKRKFVYNFFYII